MSMRADFIKEHRGDETLATERGYAEYRYLGEKQVYIVDIYVKPEFRQTGEAAAIADHIVSLAKQRGCTELLGTVELSANNSRDSMRTLLAYGMSPQGTGLVIFKKDL